MFIGHYGVSFVIKKRRPEIPLPLLFVSVQFLDVVFCSFVLLGIEKMRIVPGFTAYNPYDLFFMPYSHSLLGSLLWSFVFGVTGAWGLSQRRRKIDLSVVAASLALGVFSHFLLDFPMHVHDMPLTFSSSTKIGLGLWKHRYLSLLSELVVFMAGLLYFRPKRDFRYWVFLLLALSMLIATPFIPPPKGPFEFAVSALPAYFVSAILAGWAFQKALPANLRPKR